MVLAALTFVHVGPSAHAQAGQPAVAPAAKSAAPGAAAVSPPAVKFAMRYEPGTMPPAVTDMVDAILSATHSGDIEDLRAPIEWNEMAPIFTPGKDEPATAGTDGLIAHLRKTSRDGHGREMLAILADLLSVGPAQQPLGRDFENNAVFVWPYLAELPLDALTPAQEVDFYRLVPAEKIIEMRAAKRWTWYRLVIGADGTWHSFMPHP